MPSMGRLVFPLCKVNLLLIVDLVELSGIVELEGRKRFELEVLLIEDTGFFQVIDDQGDMVYSPAPALRARGSC